MKDKIKELIKSGEYEDLIIEALVACNNVRDHFNSVQMNGVFSGVADAWHCGEDLKQALHQKKKPVDMSVFVGSPIDCEFKESERSENWLIGSLTEIKGDSFINDASYYYQYCKPRMNYPFSLALWGFDNRKINELKADLHLSGFKTETYYSDSRWVAISIEGLQDGYCWPWECER